MYYERLNKTYVKKFYSKADIIIKIDKKHRLKSIKFFK